MSLSDWLASRWLVARPASIEEITDLFSVVDRDLEDAAVPRLSPDWRLGISYNAALQLAILALAAAGYRPGRERAHERAILSLRETVGVSSATVDLLDAVRRKRNQSNYERVQSRRRDVPPQMTAPVPHLTSALSDRYTIEGELGAGGMATVYLARDLKHDRKVAVKVLRPEPAWSPDGHSISFNGDSGIRVIDAESGRQHLVVDARRSMDHLVPRRTDDLLRQVGFTPAVLDPRGVRGGRRAEDAGLRGRS